MPPWRKPLHPEKKVVGLFYNRFGGKYSNQILPFFSVLMVAKLVALKRAILQRHQARVRHGRCYLAVATIKSL